MRPTVPKGIVLVGFVVVTLMIGSPVAALAVTAQESAPPPGVLAAIAPHGAWCWFGDPRAVFHAGRHRRTYVGWTSRNGVEVAQYDHTTGDVLTRRVSAPGFLADGPRLTDDHANPSLMLRPDGRVVVFWSAHGGAEMFYRVSTHPEDISTFGPERTVGTNTPGPYGYTYPNPVRLAAEDDRVFLFWRGGNFQPTVATTTDLERWTPARTVLTGVSGHRPYVKVATDGDATIHLAFTEASPNVYPTSIYYAAYRNGAYRRADGTVIASAASGPFSFTAADRVYDGSVDLRSWVHDVAHDADGHPMILYARLDQFVEGTVRVAEHTYHHARWDGTRWVSHPITAAGRGMSERGEHNYSGGLTFDHDDPATVYLSRQVDGLFRVERWRTTDHGATWTSEVLSTDGVSAYRPITPRGQTDESADLNVLWMRGRYPSYHDFETAIVGRTSLLLSPSAVPVVGDWDGNGRDDRGWFRPGGWWFLRHEPGSGPPDVVGRFGMQPGDVPVPGDWDGDGVDTPGIFRAGEWHLRADDGVVTRLRYGLQPGDVPVVGDWDGDGIDTPGIFRRGEWHLRSAEGATMARVRYGVQVGDRPVPGDWDGDGRDSPGIARGRGEWHARADAAPISTTITTLFGQALGDVLVPGDWDGDGDGTPGVVRAREWHLRGAFAGGTVTRVRVTGR